MILFASASLVAELQAYATTYRPVETSSNPLKAKLPVTLQSPTVGVFSSFPYYTVIYFLDRMYQPNPSTERLSNEKKSHWKPQSVAMDHMCHVELGVCPRCPSETKVFITKMKITELL